MKLKTIISNSLFLFKNLYDILFQTREKEISKILIANNLKLLSAESCTGGLISSRMTDISGSSNYTFQNFTTYSNEAKETLLGVNPELIEKNGVVSEEVSSEMVRGLLNKYEGDIAISTTGIAGPTGGSKEKPQGLVYISVGNREKINTYRFEAPKYLSRRIMKYAFSNKALSILSDFLKDNYLI